jgi:hypothetical protein
MTDPSITRFRAVVAGALAHLESRRQEINDLNVFPVADGDTGDNMALTLRACLDELERLAADDQRSIDEIGRDEIVESVSRAALLGARGNSGVILSQLIRGAAGQLISTPGQLIDPMLMAAAMSRAAKHAYASVRQPAEGTILTVMRDMADAALDHIAHAPERATVVPADAEGQNRVLADALEHAIAVGERSLREGRDKLPALRDAGVVDAGGYGVLMVFAGVVAVLRGEDPPEIARHAPPARVTHPEHASSTFRYCTNFAVTGDGLEPTPFLRRLEALGDSVLVVGDAHTLKVHVHTDDPDAAFAVFAGAGAVSHLDVADMREQVSERAARLNGAPPSCGAVAVATGEGVKAMYRSLGVDVLDGGPTLNPSTRDLLTAIHAVEAEQVVVLPNSPNVFMAAERAAELSDKAVVVVQARTPQAGLSAALALDPRVDARANARAMEEALALVRTGGVAPAARADGQGRFSIGDAVGFVDEELVAWGSPEPTLRAVVERLCDGAELLTAIRGEGAPDADVSALAPAGVEVEESEGGQPAWWWLLAAE